VIKAVTETENAMVGIDGQDDEKHETTQTVYVMEEEQKVSIKVIAEDGTIFTHELLLQKYSKDNTLAKLSAEGIEEESITQTSDNTYQIIVPNDKTTLNVTAEASKSVASVKIKDDTYSKHVANRAVDIPNDTNTFTITVQAENGDEKEYTVTVIKKYVLTIDQILVNNVKAEQTEDGYLAWIDRNADLSTVNITLTSDKAKVKVGEIADGIGSVSFNIDTSDEEKTLKIVVSSPIDSDEVEYTLRIAKKSNDTSLEYVKVGNSIGELENDTYIVKVSEQTQEYEMEVKTMSEYAKVKIDANDYKDQIDTKSFNLSGVNSKQATVSVIAQDGTTKEYTVIIQKTSDDNTLKKVEVNGTVIQEQDGIYRAFIKAGVTSVPYIIETTNENAMIQINTEETETKHIVSRTLNMEGDNPETIQITVTSETGAVKTYTLIIARESNDAELEWIKVDGKAAIEVSENTYYITALAGAETVKIEASASNEYANVQIDTSAKKLKQNEITYTLPDSPKIVEVPVIITAQDGKTEKTYTLQIEQVSNDTSIETIKVNDVVVTNYNEETKTYEIIVEETVSEGAVYVKTKNEEAKVKIDTGDLTKHEVTEKVSTVADENEYDITVIAEDGTTETRTLKIKKLSQDASIVKVYVNGVEATLQTDGKTYNISVLESVENAIIKVKTTNKNASININGTDLANKGEDELTVSVKGVKTLSVPIKITAEDTAYTKSHTLNITVVSDNKALEYLKVNDVEVTDYDEETKTYFAFIPETSTSAKVSAKTVSDTATTMIEDQTGTNTITYTATTDADITRLNLSVISEDGNGATYKVVLQKKSTDNGLFEVKANGNIVRPDESGVYVVNVPESTTSVNLYAKAANEYAIVSIDGETGTIKQSTKDITLSNDKTTNVTIKVTAQNGVEATYSVVINKISSSNALEYVKVGTEVLTDYDEETKTYNAFIPADSISVTLEAKAVNSYATVTAEDASAVGLVTTPVDTDSDLTKVTIEVTAEDGNKETYTVNLRKISTDNTAKAVYVNGNVVKPDENGKYIAKVPNTDDNARLKVVATSDYAKVQIENFSEEIKTSVQYVTLSENKVTTVNVIITAQDGTKNAFEVELEKVSEDVRISSILIDGIDKTTYDEETKTYTAYIAEDSNLTNVFVMASDNNATVILEDVVNQGTATKGIVTTAQETSKTITIKAESGKSQDYTLKLIKESSDASIEVIAVNDITLNEPYNAYIKKLDTKAKLYVKATNNMASIKVGDEPAKRGSITVDYNLPLETDTIVVPIVVTSQDGKNVENKSVKITRLSNNTDIARIIINGEDVDLTDIDNLEAIVKNVDVSQIQIILADSTSKVSIDNGTEGIGGITEDIQTPVTTIRTITVTAADGTVKEYEITLTKKMTITSRVITENVMNKHIAKITVYLSKDARKEDDLLNPREKITELETNEDGTFEIILEPEMYDVVITKPGYLDYRITDINVVKGVVLGDITLLGGDVVKTGEIEIDDLVAMNNRYGKAAEGFEEYDLNGDGIIDALDRQILVKNYGEVDKVIKWVEPNAVVPEEVEAQEAKEQEELGNVKSQFNEINLQEDINNSTQQEKLVEERIETNKLIQNKLSNDWIRNWGRSSSKTIIKK